MTKRNAPSGDGRIDYERLKAELLDRATTLIPDWLPGGTWEAHEWKCADLTGGRGHSCSVNRNTGQWSDFASEGEERGGDLISLYAAIQGMEQWEAARELVMDLNLTSCIVGGVLPTARKAKRSKPPVAEKPAKVKTGNAGPVKGEFVPVMPVPDYALKAVPSKHPFRGEPQRVWKYTRNGEVLGFVYRFLDSEGEKVTIPLVWGQSQANSTQKWVWKHWDKPKPLYLPGGRIRPGLPKVIVEGEKCADAAHELLGDEFDFLTWPGGVKGVHNAAWDWLLLAEGDASPLRVMLWPDADYHRRKRTKEEKAAGVPEDSDTLDYLPAAKQPGIAAMNEIAQILQEQQSVHLWITQIPDPPHKPSEPPPMKSGWDCADAIESGWNAERCREYLRKARKWEMAAAADTGGLGSAGASGESSAPDPSDPKAWRLGLLKNPDTGKISPVRENIVLALQSLPQVKGKIAFNEFSNDVIKLADMPWGSPAGKWSEVDELLMGEWLCRKHFLPSMPRTTLEEGMRMVATRHQYHPVRQYLGQLKWDNTPRLNGWLIRAAVGEPEKLRKKERMYLERVGAWFLMGMVDRALSPGCKFDYMPILEGSQGMRKSTVLNILGGAWFADTGFVLGEKDSLQMLQGRWLYEISELDAMARAEVTKIKAFIASKFDWYRASFDKRPREYPRQLVFAGTTNEHQYLVDSTGNRRFWPVDVTRVIDTEWVTEVRDQLFAEAVVRVMQKERYHPTQREELELFLPQQNERLVESPIETKILDYLVNNTEGSMKTNVQIVHVLGAIGIDITKLGPGRFHEKQAGAALRRLGWQRRRASVKVPGRPWGYERPANWPDCLNLDELEEAPAPASAKSPAAAPAARPEPPVMEEEAPGRADDERDGNDPW